MSDKNIYAIIVLYNKKLEDSITYNCIKEIKGINIIICDNSIENYFNDRNIKHKNIKYINMEGNKGLSKAYNKAIDSIGEEEGIICLFDDDTKVNQEYFKKIKDILEEGNKSDIYLPLVYDKEGLLSPSYIKGVMSGRIPGVTDINDIRSIDKRYISGINSGMAINLNVFKNYRYDEKYFLDSVDHNFIRNMKEQSKKIEIIDVKLDHDFFGGNKSSLERALSRFDIYRKDFRRFCNINIKSKIICELILLKNRIELFLKYKSIIFFTRW